MAARYKILEELGAGGAGAVFKAYDTQLDRYVAIKRLMSKEESEKQDSQSGSLKKEAASLATLQHPNIVAVYDLGSDDGGFFMVMEMVDGETLSDWVRTTPMNLTDFQELATQSLEAVMTAHGQSILHRDLKPENIKIKRLPGGRIQVKVLDFGLARMSYGAKKMTEDQKGNIIGSIYYMAPEQFLRKPVDVRTDLYSLGCVYYQALSCRRPYEDETVKGVMDAHLKHMVHPLKTVAPEVPQPVCDWIMWLINAEPQHRPANAQAALNSLREIIAAGWFSDSAAATPVAIPVEDHGGWRQTSTVPRVPTSSQVRPATGAVSQRITGTVPQRPSGAVPARTMAPGPRTPGVPGHAHAAVAAQPVAPPKKKLPAWMWPAAAVAVLGAAWVMWSGKKPATTSSTKTPTASTAPKPAAPSLPQRPADLIEKGAVLHYRAGEKTEAWADPGKPAAAAKPNDLVLTIRDLAGAAGEGSLSAASRLKNNCPKLIFEKPSALKSTIGFLRFEKGQAFIHRMDKNDARSKEYPFADPLTSKGVTVIMLVRPSVTDTDVRCIRLRNQDGSAYLHVRAEPDNEWKLAVKAGNTAKEAKVSGRSVKQWTLIGLTWNRETNKALLSVRSEDGGKARAETDAPKEFPGVMNEVRIADYSSDPSKPVQPVEQFSGDIAEIIVWPFAMDWEVRSGQEWKLMQHYFTKPGSRY